MEGEGLRVEGGGLRVNGGGCTCGSLSKSAPSLKCEPNCPTWFRLVQVLHFYLTERVNKVVLQMSIPAQIRQLIFYISNNKGQVDGFVRELTSTK